MNHTDLLTADNKQGLEWAKTKRYAYFMESSSIEYEIERTCEVTQIGSTLDEKGYGIAMRKSGLFMTANTVKLLVDLAKFAISSYYYGKQ